MHRIFACLLALAGFSALLAADRAAEGEARAKAVAPYLDGQTLVVMHVDVTRVDVDALISKVSEAAKLEAGQLAPLKQVLVPWAMNFTKAGGKDLYVVVNMADMPGMPVLVAPLAGDANARALTELLGGMGPMRMPAVEKMDEAIVAGSKTALASIKADKGTLRPEVAKSFAAAGDTAVQVLLLPTGEVRRLAEEVSPRLPKEVGGAPVTVVTHGVLWAAAGIDLTPQASLKLTVQSQDAKAAESLHQLLVQFSQALTRGDMARRVIPKLEKTLAVLTPAVQGDQLTLSQKEGAEGIGELLADLAAAVNRTSQRRQTANNLKQLALALHNYHDANGKFPTAAIYSKEGQPLLSWRVEILPFLGENQLYNQFHRDEPWDSEHNKTLIARRPAVFGGQGLANTNGKTRVLAPVGLAMMFSGTPQAVLMKEVTDGTSNTILLVETAPDRAVTWTKPDDLKIDAKEPTAGLLDERATGFNAAFADGSVHYLSAKIDPKTLNALFTRNGGEVIKSNEW